MIYMKAKEEGRDFYEVYDYYLEMSKNIHLRTYDYLAKKKASINPLAFMEGGLDKGFLESNDSIEPALRSATLSFGFTALHELQLLHNGKTLYEDGDFAYEVLEYLNNKVLEFKKEYNKGFAVYGTPAESLCYTQVKQFRNKYGVVEGVSDKDYFTNSFHMAVSEDITPTQKQDAEYKFFHLSNGGHIQYCRYPHGKNLEAIETVVTRGMDLGYYEGVNIEKNFCDDCGHQFDDGHVECPKCQSNNITQITRVSGYLGFSKINGTTRMNDGKLAEIADRKSM